MILTSKIIYFGTSGLFLVQQLFFALFCPLYWMLCENLLMLSEQGQAGTPYSLDWSDQRSAAMEITYYPISFCCPLPVIGRGQQEGLKSFNMGLMSLCFHDQFQQWM